MTVRNSLDNFRHGLTSVSDYQRALHAAECEIVSIEETELRALLMTHESGVKEIRFTVPEKNQSDAILRAVDYFERRLKDWIV